MQKYPYIKTKLKSIIIVIYINIGCSVQFENVPTVYVNKKKTLFLHSFYEITK